MTHVFSLSMSRAVFAETDKFTSAASFIQQPREVIPRNYEELLLEVSGCPHESSSSGCHPGPGPLCSETLRRCGPGPLSPHPGTKVSALLIYEVQF